MTDADQTGAKGGKPVERRDATRRERLAAALRQNLARRKAQSRAREDREPAEPVGNANIQD